jgi:hypothetical protein
MNDAASSLPQLPSARRPGPLTIVPSDAIAPAVVASATPVPKADYDVLVTKFNALLAACVKAGVLKSS